MFAKPFRLAKNKDVSFAFTRGRTFFSPLLTIKFLSGKSLRFAVVVSTKVNKRAVVRNRLKRICRELIKKNSLKLSPGDYMIILKPRADKVEEKMLLENLEFMLMRNCGHNKSKDHIKR